jgi:hypothetical protein
MSGNNKKFENQEQKMDDLGKQMTEMLHLLTNNKSKQQIHQSDHTKTTTVTQPQEIVSNEPQKQKKAVHPVTPWNVA